MARRRSVSSGWPRVSGVTDRTIASPTANRPPLACFVRGADMSDDQQSDPSAAEEGDQGEEDQAAGIERLKREWDIP